jgi:hypothetical protein
MGYSSSATGFPSRGTCPTCGLPLNAADAFCGNCGRESRWWERGRGRAAGSWHADGQARVRVNARDESADGKTANYPAPSDKMLWDADADRRLKYKDITGEPSFDPLHNSRFGWQLARRAGLFFLLAVIAESAMTISLGLVSLMTRSPAAVTIIPGLGFLIWAGMLLAYLLMPVAGRLAQWSRLLSLSGAASEIAFEHVSKAVQRHATPFDSFRPRTLMPPGEGFRRYLELRRGVFAGFISCFPHGRDLYVGWTFWIYMSPLRLAMMKIGRKVQDWTGRGNDMHQTLRYESTRATIAALHACTLEGVEAAIRILNPEINLPDGDGEINLPDGDGGVPIS